MTDLHDPQHLLFEYASTNIDPITGICISLSINFSSVWYVNCRDQENGVDIDYRMEGVHGSRYGYYIIVAVPL